MADETNGRVSGNVSTSGSVSGAVNGPGSVGGNVAVPGGKYILPPATSETLGGIMVGDGLNIDEVGILSAEAKLAKGSALIPVYMGDYISYGGRGLQSMCVVGDKVYTANTNGTEQAETRSDIGTIRVFDMTQNIELTELRKEVDHLGHANSMCYDSVNECFYVAPEGTYVSGQRVDTYWINKFDKDFNFIESIPTAKYAQAVSYDPVAETMYYYGWGGSGCYKWTDNGWEFVCTFDYYDAKPGLNNANYNQDFAVYNGRYYLTHANNNMISGVLQDGVSYADSSFVYLTMENRSRFRLGETQGMEFTPDGHLFAGNNVTLTGSACNSFVVELPVGTRVPYATNLRGNYDGFVQGELTMSDDSVSAFALAVYQIRSLAQLYALSPSKMVSSVWIPAGSNIVEDMPIRTNQDFVLKVGGHYTCQQFEVFGGHLNIQPMDARSGDDWHITITTDGHPFELIRAGRLSFTGSSSLRFNLPNRGTRYNFVYAGSYKSVFVTSYRPSSVQALGTLQCAGNNIGYDTVQFGGTMLPESYKTLESAYTQNSYVAESGFNCELQYTHGYAPAMLIIDFTLAQPLPVNTDVQIGEFLGLLNRTLSYNVIGADGGAPITLTLGTNCEVTLRTTGETKAGGRYCTVAACYISNNNR